MTKAIYIGFCIKKRDNWFDNKTDQTTQKETDLINKYVFNDFDMTKYLLSDTISVADFQKKYKINLSPNKMKSLRKAHSLAPDENVEAIIVSYVFDDKIICRNIESDDLQYGSEYNSKTNLFGGISYDLWFIDGVFFK